MAEPETGAASEDRRIRTVVVVGGGTAGWMAAATFSRYLNNGYTRTILIESEEIGTVGVGEATIPPITTFNAMLGIDENDFLRATQGTYKLAIEFTDWGAIGERYLHPFGRPGRDIEGVQFHQLYLRERSRRRIPDITAYWMSATAARHGRFQHPSQSRGSPAADILYAFHFDAGLYARFLRTYAERGGVTRIEGKIVDVALRGEDGFVESVTLEGGRTIEGDLFIDCSGFRGLLIEQALKTGYEDWTRWLPCDRAIAVATENVGDPDPFTRSAARSAGWQWRIPLQHRTGNGHVYSSAHMSDDEAERILLDNLVGPAISTPRQLSFTTGMRNQAWNRNVIALGLSSGFLEPLESTSIHLIQTGISRLMSLFPDRDFNPAIAAEYNRQLTSGYRRIRDFIILHYHATRRDDSDFWNQCRTMSIPDTLQHKIDLFRAGGRVFREDEELFDVPNWVGVMLGQNIVPGSYDPIADALDEEKVSGAMEQIRTVYEQTAQRLPTHAQYLASHCQAPAMTPTGFKQTA